MTNDVGYLVWRDREMADTQCTPLAHAWRHAMCCFLLEHEYAWLWWAIEIVENRGAEAFSAT